LGDEISARNTMNLIRERAGMPNVPDTETGTALVNRYRNERRVELAWEGHRFSMYVVDDSPRSLY